MKVGFTGTRKGLTSAQEAQIGLLLIVAHEAHHGDCEGGDAQFHDLAQHLRRVIHPPENPKLRAYCQGADEIREPLPYLDRNRNIVDETELLIGAPKENHEPPPMRGQGTWSTIRYARRMGKPGVIVWPSGREERFNH